MRIVRNLFFLQWILYYSQKLLQVTLELLFIMCIHNDI